MSNEEKKTEETKTETRGDRGEVGTATAGLTVRQMWRGAAFTRESANDKHNPNKRIYVRIPGSPSLKAFARKLLKEGHEVAQEWFGNKRGAKNQKRSDANIKAARETSAASMAARKARSSKKKGG